MNNFNIKNFQDSCAVGNFPQETPIEEDAVNLKERLGEFFVEGEAMIESQTPLWVYFLIGFAILFLAYLWRMYIVNGRIIEELKQKEQTNREAE